MCNVKDTETPRSEWKFVPSLPLPFVARPHPPAHLCTYTRMLTIEIQLYLFALQTK